MYTTFITINTLNAKGYIGMTGGNSKYYKGSGKAFIKAIYKYGTEYFIRYNLGYTPYEDEAHYWECFYIKYLKTHISEYGYNISKTGGLYYNGKHSDETKQKMSKNCASKRPEVKEKLCKSLSGKNNPMYGKKHSEETKQKMYVKFKENKKLNKYSNKGEKNGMFGKPSWNKGLKGIKHK